MNSLIAMYKKDQKMKKRIDRYYMNVGRIAMDVFRGKDSYFVTVADWKTNARMAYTLSGTMIYSTVYDEELFTLATRVVQRNIDILQSLAKEREQERRRRIKAGIAGAVTFIVCCCSLKGMNIYEQKKNITARNK